LNRTPSHTKILASSSGQNKKYNCLVVLGPTASGKTQLACGLAYYLGGEIISADSRQVYRRLDIGTGKDMSAYTVHGKPIPYHLIDIAEPEEQFFLHDFTRLLAEAFSDIASRNQLPVICGGTGLYLDVLRKDFSLTAVPEDHRLRSELDHHDKSWLTEELKRISPEQAGRTDLSSRKRIIRGIEIAHYLQDHPLPKRESSPTYLPYYLGIDLSVDERRRRIAERLDERLNGGMIPEADALLKSGMSHGRLQRLGLEYKFLSLHLLGELSREELRTRLLTAIQQYAKRQMTWFRKMEKEGVAIHWVKAGTDPEELAESLRPLFGR
jgi:tRNA dimethylallyltransferase